MSQVPVEADSTAASASGSEKVATSPSSIRHPTSAPPPAPKLRSCVVCRSRKVRCDKQSPCSNCRRANIACVFPKTDRPPKWSRRLEHLTTKPSSSQDATPDVAKVMDRLWNLESLVKELRGQLEQAHAAAGSVGGGSSPSDSSGRSKPDQSGEQYRETSSASSPPSLQNQFGRLVVQDANRSRYVSSGFWSRVNDELKGLEVDTRGLAVDESDASEDEASSARSPSSQEWGRTPSERNAFLFRHNLTPSSHELRELHPLPSQIPFLLEIFSENVNLLFRIVHIPTVTKLVREMRGSDMTHLTPANEALMFSIYYAAITSMEEEDVVTNFGSSKSDLVMKYRLGLEQALAKADFLNAPDMVVIQAFTLFLGVVRRNDSPRYVWMMTGLVIRMAQYLGYHRDGSHFEHLTPFEMEMRRRIWWALCHLDMRASEDQGTDLTIARDSFDTKIPLHINDADISPDTTEMPAERSGETDMSYARMFIGMCDLMRQMMFRGGKDGAAALEDQSRLLNEMYEKYEQGYFPPATMSENIGYWTAVTVVRLTRAKMMLIVFLPVLFSSPSEHLSEEIRTKLLVSAIEVAEYNHLLNTEPACRQWRWIYQSYTHWHSIVFLMIEISRRPWSPIVERAWIALHSSWLIPDQTPLDKNLRIWVPLRKLMAKARKHREIELNRLRSDPQAVTRLEMEDQKIPLPSSPGLLPTGSNINVYRERWYQLVANPAGGSGNIQSSGISSTGLTDPSIGTAPTSYNPSNSHSNTMFEQPYIDSSNQSTKQPFTDTNLRNLAPAIPPSASAAGQPEIPSDWSDQLSMGPGVVPWLWAASDPSVDMFSGSDMEINMDLDGEVNWYSWVDSAEGLYKAQ